MGKLRLLATLNIKIIFVVSLLMVTGYYYWATYEEVVGNNEKSLVAITNFLNKQIDPAMIMAIEAAAQANNITGAEKADLYNLRMQQYLNSVCMPLPNIKYGYYSNACQTIVAIGPNFDDAVFLDSDSNVLQDNIFNGEAARFIKKDKSSVWYGNNVLYYIKPLSGDDKILGYTFAVLDIDKVASVVLNRTSNMFGVILGGLLICILVFWGLFRKLEQELYKFAKQLVDEQACDYESNIPELAPVFNYIGDQTKKFQQMERLDLVSKMAAGLAHEIRNPLTTVRGFLQLMSRKREFADYQDKLTLMIEELDCANRITTEFLSLSQEKAMNFHKDNLNELIRNIYPLLQSEAAYHDCSIKLQLADIPLCILDKSSMNQLILNLFKNALEAMPQGGEVKIATLAKGKGVYLIVRDNGEGIPEAVRDKIGTPFFTTKEKGTGLGVSICMQIIKRHGASVKIDSVVGKGTKFTICFPYAVINK